MPKKKKGGRVISVDFRGVEAGKDWKPVPDGFYLVKTKEVTQEVSEKSGQPYLKWTFEVVEPIKYKGKYLWYNTSLQPQALFNLRNLLEAMETEVPESIVNLNLDDYVDLELCVEVEIGSYEGKKKNEIVDLLTVADYYDEDSEEDEDDEVEDSEEDEDDDEEEDDEEETDEDEIDYEEMDVDALKELCEDRGIKLPKKVNKKKLISLLEEADEDEAL